jgi:hypothetical protein
MAINDNPGVKTPGYFQVVPMGLAPAIEPSVPPTTPGIPNFSPKRVIEN